MEDTATLSVKTDKKTKEMIRTAANRFGLSMSSFIITVVRQAAKSNKIDSYYLSKINEAEVYNEKHKHEVKSWSALKNEYGV